MKTIKLLILGFLLVIAMSFVNAGIDNPDDITIYTGDSVDFKAFGGTNYKWNFDGALGEEKYWSYVFITKNTYDANLGGLAGADAIVQAEADAAGLPGTYKAWLSDSTTSAASRLNIYNNYRLVDGTVIKENELLTYSPPGYIEGGPVELIKNPINKDAYGNNINDYVWTATRYNGDIASSQFTCKDWTSSASGNYNDISEVGSTAFKTNGWTRYMPKKCNEKLRLYGLQQDTIQIDDNIIKVQNPGKITFSKPGIYNIKLSVDNSIEDSVTVTVLEVPKPELYPLTNKYVNENEELQFVVLAQGIHENLFTFSASALPAGAEFTTQDNKKIDTVDLEILKYFFGNSLIYREDLDFNNDGEIDISDIGRVTNIFGAKEGDSNYIEKYDVSRIIPNALFKWKPNFNQQGDYPITFIVNNDAGSVSKTITINVNNVNQKPVFNMNDITADALQLIRIYVSATDADGDSLTYSATNLPNGAIFWGDRFDWTPRLDQTGTYIVKFYASDSKDSVETGVKITVNTPANLPPSILPIQDRTFPEDSGILNNIIDLYIYASDPETPDSGLTFSLSQSNTNIISCSIDSNRYIDCQTKTNTNGFSDITVSVSDGIASASYTFRITINPIDDVPVVTSTPVILATKNILYQYQLIVNEVDGDPLTYTLITAPTGMTISNNGLIQWTPTAAGPYSVVAQVSDGKTPVQQSFSITVNNVAAPVINLFSPSQTNIILVDNVNFVFSTTSSDQDSPVLIKKWYVNNVEKATGDSFTFNYPAGTYTVKFKVSDGQLEATKEWNVTVTAVPVTTNYNIPALPADLTNVAGFYINKETKGRIDFLSALDLSNVGNLDDIVIIGDGIIGINTAVYPQLNKQATITMKGLTFTETPTIYYTTGFTANINEINTVCNFCSNISYSNGILTFKVDHFTTFAVKQVSKLIIEDLDVKVDDKTDSNVLNGETINQDAKPGSTITLSLDIRNNLGKDINDITVKATLKAIDDGEDLEEESNEFDLNIGKKKSETIKLNIPYEVDEGSYDLAIHVEGEDEDSKLQQTDWTIKLVVSKKSHEIVISKADLGNELLECVRTTNLNIEILNTGSEEEDDVKIVVKSEDLGIDFEQDNIKLTNDVFDEESKYAKTIRIQLSNDFNEGIYPITVEVYRDNKLESSKELTLQVGICQVKEVAEAEKGISIVSEKKIIPVKEAEKIEDIELIAALAGGVIIVLILVILALYLGFRKK